MAKAKRWISQIALFTCFKKVSIDINQDNTIIVNKQHTENKMILTESTTYLLTKKLNRKQDDTIIVNYFGHENSVM